MRDQETRKLIIDATKEQMRQAQDNLRGFNKMNFNKMMATMQATARETDAAQRKQMAELLKEQSEREREMTNASIEEKQAMRTEFIEARKEKEEEMRRIREENQTNIRETTVRECSKIMLEQADNQRKEMNEMSDARLSDQREHAETVNVFHEREIALTRGFAAAMVNMTINQANSRENATIVELSNSLRESLSETRSLHHNAVETAQLAMNNFNFDNASLQLGHLGQRVDLVDMRRAEFVRALNRANTSNRQLIARQMTAIGHLELALSVYRMAVGKLRAKMTSPTPIEQSDIDEFNAVQMELTKRMIEMPLIDANDVYGEVAANARQALEGSSIRALEQRTIFTSSKTTVTLQNLSYNVPLSIF